MRKTCVSLFISVVLFASCSKPVPTPEEISAVESRLKSGASEKHHETLVHLYERRGFQPIWIADGQPTERVQSLSETLSQASNHGLNPADYNTAPSPDPIDYELQLSRALVEFAFDVAGKHEHVEPLLAAAIDQETLPQIVDQLAPKHVEYRNLQRALQTYVGPEENTWLIKENLKKLRELPADLGRRYIRVNIPEYRLAVIEDGQEVLAMNVVVGKAQTPTPVFSDDMTHLVFSPYWNIPESILANETLPKAVEDADYLRKQNIEIVRVSGGEHEIVDPSEIDWSDRKSRSGYHFRQRPGAANSLGLVKFMFPNRFNVYLHDTPADSLFERDERSFSHGCIRIEQPLELAKYLLRDQPQWSEKKILGAMRSGHEKTVKLSEPVPVHIMYLTAWAAPDGTVHFGKDVYNLGEDGE